MKVHPSCVQELNSLFARRGAVGCDIDTVILKGRSRQKRTRKLLATYFGTSGLKSKRHAIVSICNATLFPFCSSCLCKPNLLSRGIRIPFSCSPNDADYVEAQLQGISDENPVPLTYADSYLEEEEKHYARGEAKPESESELVYESDEENGFRIQIVKLGKRSRRVESSILIKASLSTIWEVLTDYERLADFIPGLAVSRLLDKRGKYARLFQVYAAANLSSHHQCARFFLSSQFFLARQRERGFCLLRSIGIYIGQQNLAFGLKFNAKAVLDCYEKDLEVLSYGQRRDIEFKMVEGDFETFEGRWSIVQYDAEMVEAAQAFDILEGQEFQTTLFYEVELEPKLWLPVRLVEGRICKEIKTNLSSIRQEAQIRVASSS